MRGNGWGKRRMISMGLGYGGEGGEEEGEERK
jgi:hypothetical protein